MIVIYQDGWNGIYQDHIKSPSAFVQYIITWTSTVIHGPVWPVCCWKVCFSDVLPSQKRTNSCNQKKLNFKSKNLTSVVSFLHLAVSEKIFGPLLPCPGGHWFISIRSKSISRTLAAVYLKKCWNVGREQSEVDNNEWYTQV